WRVQRLPLPRGNRAAHPQIHCEDRREAGDNHRPPQTSGEARDRRDLQTNGTRRSRPAFSAANTAKRPSTTAGHLNPAVGRNCGMSDWKVLYRDDLDRDRTSRSIPSKEAALGQARNLFLQQRALNYIELKGLTARP